jgi:hypothetical protein
MTHTLPADVQARLQAQAALGSLSLQQHLQPQLHAGHSSRMATLLLDVEARDPRTASDTVLQLLALRPAAAPGAALQLPSSLSSVYFTLQFYKSGPIVTDTCLLAASSYGQHTQGVGADGSAGVQGPSTFMLLPQHQACGSSPAGAGVVLKFSVDGSRASELQTGQDPVQAAAAAHMAYCKYLVSHKLAVDVWDGESLLQVRQARRRQRPQAVCVCPASQSPPHTLCRALPCSLLLLCTVHGIARLLRTTAHTT